MSQGEFFIQVATCKGRVLEVSPDPGQQFGHWATISDMLLTGHGQRILPKDAEEDEHPIKVLLAFEDTNKEAISVASVFLLCPCDIDVIAGERAASAQYERSTTPQQKIETPSLIIPR